MRCDSLLRGVFRRLGERRPMGLRYALPWAYGFIAFQRLENGQQLVLFGYCNRG
jgi:hypothetical protein